MFVHVWLYHQFSRIGHQNRFRFGTSPVLPFKAVNFSAAKHAPNIKQIIAIYIAVIRTTKDGGMQEGYTTDKFDTNI